MRVYPFAFFSMQPSSLEASFVEHTIFSRGVCVSVFFIKIHVPIGVWIYVWVSNPIPSINMSAFVSMSCCFCCYISVLLHVFIGSLQVLPHFCIHEFDGPMISSKGRGWGHGVHYSQGSLKFKPYHCNEKFQFVCFIASSLGSVFWWEGLYLEIFAFCWLKMLQFL